MKRIFFFCILTLGGLISLKTFAQSENVADSLYYLQSTESDSDSSLVEYPFAAYQEQYCSQLNITARAVVRYESSAVCYLELQDYPDLLGSTLLVLSDNEIYKAITAKGERDFLLENLPLNRNFIVQYADGCGRTTNLTSFTTLAENQLEGIVVSPKLMTMMGDYYQTMVFTLPEYLESESTLSYYEKLSFWQDIAFNDQPFADNLSYGEFPIENASINSSGSECNCRLLLTRPAFAPGYENNIEPAASIPVPTGDVAVYSGHISTNGWSEEENWVEDNPDKGKFYRSLGNKGAARRQVNWAKGRKIHTRISDLNTSASDINYSQIQILWYCFEGFFHFTDCGCRKTVDYKAKYNTHMRSQMALPSCFLCGSKKGRSKAEDLAVLTLSDQTGMVTVLDAGQGTVGSECEQTWNVDFFLNLVDVAAAIATPILSGGSTTNWGDAVDEIASSLQTLISTPVQNITGCSSKDELATLIHQNSQFTMGANVITYLTLFSMGNTTVQGATSWEGETSISSEFSLAVGISPVSNGDQPKYCCSHGLSSWIVANFETITLPPMPPFIPNSITVSDPYPSPTNMEALLSPIEGFFDALLLGFNGEQYGALLRPWCETGNKWAINSNIATNEVVAYTIFDLVGRAVYHGTALPSEMRQAQFLREKLPQKGVYVVSFNIDNKSYSFKLINP